MQHPNRRSVAVTLAVAAAAAIPSSAQALAPPRPADGSAAAAVRVKAATSYVDVRGQDRSAAAALPGLPSATRGAQRAFGRSAGADAAVALDRSTGTVRTLQRLGGRLSGRLAGAPGAAARGWARENAALLGLTAADVDALDAPETTTTPAGVQLVRFGQSADGIPTYDNDLRVALDRAGRVVTVTGSPVRGLDPGSATPAVGAADALRTVARSVGATRLPAVASVGAGARRVTRFEGDDVARLVWFRRAGATRLAWSLLYDTGGADRFHAVVDARSGALLRRVDLTKYAIPAKVFDAYPGRSGSGGTQRSVDLEALGYLPAGATTLSGPFARTYLDVDDSNSPSADEEVKPGAYTHEDFPGTGCTPTKRCSWNPLLAFSWTDDAAQAATQAHYYVSNYHDHLAAAPIGFTAADGNFEGADRVVVNADDGADTSSNGAGGLPDTEHVDNANMSTPPDGQPPLMQMYLFNDGTPLDPFRPVNGDDDAAIVYHEYTHGLSNRLVTTQDGFGALSSAQAGAMGEAWSDFYAKDYLVDRGFATDSATPGDVDMGEYTDVVPHSIRTQGLDCPVGTGAAVQCPAPVGGTAGPGGYTYGDFGKVTDGPEVHADGEIWAQTLWDLRTAVGSATAEELVTEGMRLSVPEPSYLDMRNAILAADEAATDGANTAKVWAVFAKRGMGYFAGAIDGTDVAPVEDFSTPPDAAKGTGTIAGTVTDADTGGPAPGVRVGVAGHTTPGDDLSAVTGADGRFAITGVPAGTYPKLAFLAGSGYDPAVSTAVAVPKDGTATVDRALRYDWASRFVGPAAQTNDDTGADYGCGVEAARDQLTGVGWSPYADAAPASAGNPHPGAPPVVTVELARAVDVTAFGIDPGATCGDDATAGTKDYRLETSPDGTTWTTAKAAAFAAADAGALNAVTPDAGATGVRYVRMTLLSSQGSAAGDSGAAFRDLSELEVYGAPAAPAPASGTAGQSESGGGAPSVPAPAPAPTATPPAGPGKPALRISPTTRAGKLRYRFTCASGCAVTAKLTIDRRTARAIRRHAGRTLAVTRRTAAGSAKSREWAIRISTKLRRSLKRAGVKRLKVTLVVTATTKANGKPARTTSKKTLRLRV